MVTIRIFDTRNEAEWAKLQVEQGGFFAEVTEDEFDGVPIQKFNVPARYRLKVNDGDFYKVTKYLASKLKSKK